MSPSIYLLTICLFLGTILLVFGMRYVSATVQAKARLAAETAYRQTAEQAVAEQARTAAALTAIQASLAEVSSRLTSVETILKAVE